MECATDDSEFTRALLHSLNLQSRKIKSLTITLEAGEPIVCFIKEYTSRLKPGELTRSRYCLTPMADIIAVDDECVDAEFEPAVSDGPASDGTVSDGAPSDGPASDTTPAKGEDTSNPWWPLPV